MDTLFLISAIIVMCVFATFAVWRVDCRKERDAQVFIALYLSGRQSGLSAEELRSRLNEGALSFSSRKFQIFLNRLVKNGSLAYENQPGGTRLYRLPSGSSMREMAE